MPSIKDVAKASGVSPATVSQVLNNGGRPVHPQTRERVLQVARHMKYRPNAVARGLVQKRMNTIGLVVQHEERPSLTNPVLGYIMDGILSVGTRNKKLTMVISIPSWEEATDYLPILCDGRCDGILLAVPPSDSDVVAELIETDIPFVLIGTHDTRPNVSCVDVDNTGAAQRIVTYLLEQGHRRIALLNSFPGSLLFVEERLAGYQRALAASDIPYDPSLWWEAGSINRNLLALADGTYADPPTALFCTTDVCALNVMHSLEERGVRIPADISIVGFDDITGAAVSRPPLTTIRQHSTQIGERATEILLAQISGGESPGTKENMPTELIVRQSATPPRR